MIRLAAGSRLAAALVLAPVVAVAPLVAGCLYTGDIVDRPHAVIEKLTSGAIFFPGDTVEFGARKAGGASDASLVACDWLSFVCPSGPGSCQRDPNPDNSASNLSVDQVFQLTVPAGHHPMQVELVCKDQNNVASGDTYDLDVGDRPPVITLQVPPSTVDHFVASVPIDMVASVTDPDLGDDNVTVTWLYNSPRASNPNDVVFEQTDADGLAYQLVPDVPGLWQVVVAADDGVGPDGVANADKDIAVDVDQPPCIALTSPTADPDHRFILNRADGPRTFALLAVSDDLDPYPTPPDAPDYLGSPAMSWQMAGPDSGGQLVPLAGAGTQVTLDPNDYAPGDLIDLRVEVDDRVGRTLPCAADQPTCSIGADSCLQRVTWGVEIR